jgi:hypothetical protein
MGSAATAEERRLNTRSPATALADPSVAMGGRASSPAAGQVRARHRRAACAADHFLLTPIARCPPAVQQGCYDVPEVRAPQAQLCTTPHRHTHRCRAARQERAVRIEPLQHGAADKACCLEYHMVGAGAETVLGGVEVEDECSSMRVRARLATWLLRVCRSALACGCSRCQYNLSLSATQFWFKSVRLHL